MPVRLELEPGERRIMTIRRHWWTVVRPAAGLLPVLAAPPIYAVADMVAPQVHLARYMSLFLLVDLTLAALLFLKWVTIDLTSWWLEAYVITSARLIEQRGIVTLERREVTLHAVHESSYSISGAEARFFNYGDLTIQTSGRGKGITFRAVAHPQKLQSLVAAQARAAREALKQSSGTGSEISRALQRIFKGQVNLHDAPTQMVPRITGIAARLQRRLNLLPDEVVIHATRRHPIVLLTQLAKPLLATCVAALACVMLVLPPWQVEAVLAAVILAWSAWIVVDWRDDIYVLTSERIIDVQRRPLVSEMRAVLPLRGLSDVVLRVSSLSGRLFRVGSLTLETQGEPLTLTSVPRPEEVQHLIFAQLDEVTRREKFRDQERLAGTLTEWFKEYHRMQDDASGAGP